MTRLTQLAGLASLVLVFGGLTALGAFAGVRVAFGVTTHMLDCGPLAETGCRALLARLNQIAQTFLVGGGVAMICGALGQWALERAPDDGVKSDAETGRSRPGP